MANKYVLTWRMMRAREVQQQTIAYLNLIAFIGVYAAALALFIINLR